MHKEIHTIQFVVWTYRAEIDQSTPCQVLSDWTKRGTCHFSQKSPVYDLEAPEVSRYTQTCKKINSRHLLK